MFPKNTRTYSGQLRPVVLIIIFVGIFVLLGFEFKTLLPPLHEQDETASQEVARKVKDLQAVHAVTLALQIQKELGEALLDGHGTVEFYLGPRNGEPVYWVSLGGGRAPAVYAFCFDQLCDLPASRSFTIADPDKLEIQGSVSLGDFVRPLVYVRFRAPTLSPPQPPHKHTK